MSNIVEKLRETKSLRNKLLASAIERRQQSNTFIISIITYQYQL